MGEQNLKSLSKPRNGTKAHYNLMLLKARHHTGRCIESSILYKKLKQQFPHWFSHAVKWTLDMCQEDAKNYKTKGEWIAKNENGYKAAQSRRWLKYCCGHMTKRFTWTKKRVIEDAKKYTKVGDWAKSSGGYHYAIKNNLIDNCTKHMSRKRFPNNYWTLERCLEDAKKYKTKSEWRKSAAYSKASKRGWVDDCCQHMPKDFRKRDTESRLYWTKERCIEESKKYSMRFHWIKASESSYNSAKRNGWLKECCAHMIYKRK